MDKNDKILKFKILFFKRFQITYGLQSTQNLLCDHPLRRWNLFEFFFKDAAGTFFSPLTRPGVQPTVYCTLEAVLCGLK
jgi:hypothetical protein